MVGHKRGGGGQTGGDMVTFIRFETYNYHNGINEGLYSALWLMAQANLDLWVFQDTKFMDRIHTGESEGKCSLATDALIWNCGGASVL